MEIHAFSDSSGSSMLGLSMALRDDTSPAPEQAPTAMGDHSRPPAHQVNLRRLMVSEPSKTTRGNLLQALARDMLSDGSRASKAVKDALERSAEIVKQAETKDLSKKTVRELRMEMGNAKERKGRKMLHQEISRAGASAEPSEEPLEELPRALRKRPRMGAGDISPRDMHADENEADQEKARDRSPLAKRRKERLKWRSEPSRRRPLYQSRRRHHGFLYGRSDLSRPGDYRHGECEPPRRGGYGQLQSQCCRRQQGPGWGESEREISRPSSQWNAEASRLRSASAPLGPRSRSQPPPPLPSWLNQQAPPLRNQRAPPSRNQQAIDLLTSPSSDAPACNSPSSNPSALNSPISCLSARQSFCQPQLGGLQSQHILQPPPACSEPERLEEREDPH